MPRRETTVPKFGDWDGSEDLSYSIVFDKARADKERLIHAPEKDPSNASHEQQRLRTADLFAEDGAADTISNRNADFGSRGFQENTPKMSSRHNSESAIHFEPSQTTQRNQSETSEKGSLDNSSMVANDGLHGRTHRVPGPTRQMYDYPVMSKFTRSRGSETSSVADLPEKGNVPKFGDWDVNDASAGEGFTVIFDRARDEKKSKGSRKMPGRFISPRPAEDLYHKSQLHKKKRGWPSILCCYAETHD